MADTVESLCFRIAVCGTKYDPEDVILLNDLLLTEWYGTGGKSWDNIGFNNFHSQRLRQLGWVWEYSPDHLCRLVSLTAEEADEPFIVEVRR